QSFGVIALLIPISLIVTGINIIINKKIFLIIESIFYTILYSIFGSLLFSFFYPVSFELYINGNGGFIGSYLVDTFLNSIISINSQISYYILALLILILFLISIQFKVISFYKIVKKIFKFLFSKKEKNYTNENEIINEFIPQDKIKSLIQEDLPFIKSENKIDNKKSKFKLPSIDLLKIPTQKDKEKLRDDDYIDSGFLEKILLDFGVSGGIKKVSHGPVVTLNEFEPAAGVKVSKIINLSDDIARNTSSESARIATIPGRSTIGIELPNSTRENVYLSEILSNSDFAKKDIKLPIALGKNISGIPVVGDLTSMPHLLIAGTTGSGKSVCINTIILSLLYRHTPDKCKFILIDPKMLELSTYEGIPHLLCPVITEAKKAASVLGWVVKEMENRYRLMTKEGVRNIDSYNSKHTLAMPYIVVVVDEMSDLMLVAGKEIENYIQKLSQMARAAGIHIIMATQRPSVDVITGTIKANFPTRISFQVTSKIDSRTILGEQGAEQLLGKGDMLYMSSANRIVRIHAPFVSDNEIEKVNNYLRSQAEPDYIDEILSFADEKEIGENLSSSNDKDELYQAALDIIRSEGKASTSFLQRKLQIGYNRAARIIDMMEADGIVSKANHVGKRDVL
ncbi:DNA translocase FtsK, partial [Pelagibacteraceae bacterium]|nr:DNA translocase FtsK [Pelagibacteraceae bacterium]